MPSELNIQKYENYKEQMKRLDRALTNGFNLEAMFIEYAIMEDRTESILRHGDLWEAYLKKRGRFQPSIESKINYIQARSTDKTTLLHKYFDNDLLAMVLEWKEERNRLIHALLKQEFAHNEVSELAQKGKKLVDELKKRSGNYSRAIERQKAKAEK